MQRLFMVLHLVTFTFNFGCDSTGNDGHGAGAAVEPTRYDLVDNRFWVRVEGEQDPWSESKPSDAEDCTDVDLDVEEQPDGTWFDVVTKGCGYVTVHQTLQHDIPKGAQMTVRIWHFKMSGWEGTFQLAYQIGMDGPPEWKVEKEVPSASGLIYEQWAATRDYQAGDDVYFNVSNHGENTWSLIEFSATY